MNRLHFLRFATSLLGVAGLTSFATASPKRMLSHHVFFWLKNPQSEADKAKLIEGLQTLRKIETVREIHLGVPASTEQRDVVDHSYSVSELIFFDDVKGQDTYQDHPIHQAFVKNYSHLWNKVVVYDAMDI